MRLIQYEKEGNLTTVESKKWVNYPTYCWCTRKCDKDWLICKNRTTKLKSFREIAPKELKKHC